jgi:phosphate uptake regulator
MFRDFISIFQTDDPLSDMSDRFTRMLTLTGDMALAAGRIYFDGEAVDGARQRIYDQDIEVNRYEREIRKLIVAHLSIRLRSADLPHCLFLLSLVKDVERLGDYAKNLSELVDVGGGAPPPNAHTAELLAIRAAVEQAFRDTPEIVSQGQTERAVTLINEGRLNMKRCEALLRLVAETADEPRSAVSLALGARYYKRFNGHLLNILSSVVMPLHKLDFFDEDEVDRKGE